MNMNMTRQGRLTKSSRTGRAAAGRRVKGGAANPRAKGIPPKASEPGKLPDHLLELYRPLKKPITVRIDREVLAWFKKDGSRYQTRINGALREFMEREMRQR